MQSISFDVFYYVQMYCHRAYMYVLEMIKGSCHTKKEKKGEAWMINMYVCDMLG